MPFSTQRNDEDPATGDGETRLADLGENMLEVLSLGTPDRQSILYVSPSYEQVWGRSCASLLASPRTWFEAIHPEDAIRVRERLAAGCQGAHRELEYRIVRPDGSERWIRERIFAVRDASGAFSRIAGLAEDVTGFKAAETARRQLELQQHQSRNLEALVAVVSRIEHDFNNLLAVILGNAELAATGDLMSPSLGICLDEITKAGQGAKLLVRQLLSPASPIGIRSSSIDDEPRNRGAEIEGAA